MAAKAESLKVTLTPAPVDGKTGSLLSFAQGLVITDKVSHAVCRTNLAGAKALKREIEEHYKAIKGPINAARSAVLEMEKVSLAPVEEAIRVLERMDVGYVREQERITLEREAEQRRIAEAEERQRREKEAAVSEAVAIELEMNQTAMSDRERKFFDLFVVSDRSAIAAVSAAKAAGYQDHVGQARRLVESAKIQANIMAYDKAAAVREEAAAKLAAPVLVEVTSAESQIAEVAGTGIRRYYGCSSSVDLKALIGAVLDGRVPMEAIQPNMVHLNQAARSLKEHFPKVYTGCALSMTEGITARR